MQRLLNAAVLVFLFWTLQPPVGLACGPAELAAFIDQAMSLDPQALPLGANLQKCPDERDAAQQWQAFVLQMTKGRQSATPAQRATSLPNSSARERQLQWARAGNPIPLLAQFEHETPGYQSDKEATLVLARSLVRSGDFARGRNFYQAFKRLAPRNEEAEIEYLYTFIWEQRYLEAAARFTSAARSQSSAKILNAVARGQDLIKRLGNRVPVPSATSVRSPPHPPSRVEATGTAPQELTRRNSADGNDTLTNSRQGPEQTEPRSLKVFAETSTLAKAFLKRTAGAEYSGLFEAAVAVHNLQDKALSDEDWTLTEGALGLRQRPFWEGEKAKLQMSGHIGFATLGETRLLGDLTLDLTSKLFPATELLGAPPVPKRLAPWSGSLRLTREPVAKFIPLTQDVHGLMRDRAVIGVSYGAWLQGALSSTREGSYAPWIYYRVLGQLLVVTDDAHTLSLRLPVTLEERQRPNPNYDTDQRTWTAALGLEWHASLHRLLNMTLVSDVITEQRQAFHASAPKRSAAIWASSLNATLLITAATRIDLGGTYAQSHDDTALKREGRERRLMLSLARDI